MLAPCISNMVADLKNSLKRNLLLDRLWSVVLEWEFKKWQRAGEVAVPVPHLVKQGTVLEYASRFAVPVFIETGTYLGFMTAAVANRLSAIYSIELDSRLYERARRKFHRNANIAILQGDSASLLPVILHRIAQPCLFWLDAHYSGGITAKADTKTPVMLELNHIIDHSRRLNLRHVLLIDDARLFVGENDYPTLETVRQLLMQAYPDYHFEVKYDIIRVHP